MFHRVDDPDTLDVARYFQLAEMLPSYQGAVRTAALREAATEPDYSDLMAGAPTTGAPAHGPAMHHHVAADMPAATDDVASLAAASQQWGFPGIEYTPANDHTVTHADALPFVPDNVRQDFD